MLQVFTKLADWFTYSVAGLPPDSRWAPVLHFFVEDTVKIYVLVTVMIFLIGIFRAGVNSELIRAFLSGKRRLAGYFLASGFGAVTPFCSCSSIPLFLGFTSARIPL
ncbi:MAG: permease, partial [Spirochaetaceae bacterium]|nr:permease [Spirochaetaceae bacterium]